MKFPLDFFMHIIVIGSYAPSLLNFRGPLIRALLDAGHQVSVCAPNIETDTYEALKRMGVAVYETPLERTGTGIRTDLRYYRALKQILLAVQPAAVLTYTIKPNIWGGLAAASVGIPSYAMVTGLGYAFTDSGSAPSLKRRVASFVARQLYRAAARRNRYVIFQNPDDIKDFMAAGCLADEGKAKMIAGSGVDMIHYARAPLPDAPVVLMIARLLAAKGVRDYAAAASILRTHYSTARFLLVGPFDQGPDAVSREEIAQWVTDGLEYIGSLDDVRPAIAQARIYVLPSYYREGTPRSILEAMAMGRPIITCDAPGCRETVEHGVNGLLIPVRDPQALATAIDRLLQNPTEAEAMGEASYALIARKYDVNLVNRAIMEIMGLIPDPAPAMGPA